MNKPNVTRSTARKRAVETKAPVKRAVAKSRAVKAGNKAAAKADKPARKPRTVSKPRTTAKPKKAATRKPRAAKVAVRRGGGAALSDFLNSDKLRVLKGREISRKGIFRNGQTVEQNLALQKKAGLRGRRKYIRTQIAAGRVAIQK